MSTRCAMTFPVTGCPCHNCEAARREAVYLGISDAPVVPAALQPCLPSDAKTRNELPMAEGCLDYFPLALAYIAYVSMVANEQHNPGEKMHWARGKSTDHRNKIMKHLCDCGTSDTDGLRHTGKMAWRALAELQKELEDAGWGGPGRASIFPIDPTEI